MIQESKFYGHKFYLEIDNTTFTIPNEIIHKIGGYLNLQDYPSVILVCKDWKELFDDNLLIKSIAIRNGYRPTGKKSDPCWKSIIAKGNRTNRLFPILEQLFEMKKTLGSSDLVKDNKKRWQVKEKKKELTDKITRHLAQYGKALYDLPLLFGIHLYDNLPIIQISHIFNYLSVKKITSGQTPEALRHHFQSDNLRPLFPKRQPVIRVKDWAGKEFVMISCCHQTNDANDIIVIFEAYKNQPLQYFSLQRYLSKSNIMTLKQCHQFKALLLKGVMNINNWDTITLGFRAYSLSS